MDRVDVQRNNNLWSRLVRAIARKDREMVTDPVEKILEDAVRFATEKWLYFLENIPFKEGTSLEVKIYAFSDPAVQGLKNNFPALRTAEGGVCFYIIAMGIWMSGTHSRDEAMAALEDAITTGRMRNPVSS